MSMEGLLGSAGAHGPAKLASVEPESRKNGAFIGVGRSEVKPSNHIRNLQILPPSFKSPSMDYEKWAAFAFAAHLHPTKQQKKNAFQLYGS